MPAILIDAPIITPQPSTTQPAATDSGSSANEGPSFKSALDKEMSNQVAENKNETKPGKSDKAEDSKTRDTGTSDANADSAITQPDLTALHIPVTNTVAVKATDPARDDTQELIDTPRIKQGVPLDPKAAAKQSVADDGMAIQPKDSLRPGLNIKNGGKIQSAQGKDADSKDSKISPANVLGPDQKVFADDAKQIAPAGHDRLTIRHDSTDALPKAAEQQNPPETVRNDSVAVLSPDIRPSANQPQAPGQAQSLPSQATTRIDAQLATGAWNDALGQQVVMMVTEKQQQAEIHLNPAEMGPIKITLTLDNNQASLSFLVHQSATREAIESALPKLNEMMSESGITLSQTNVQADTSGSFNQTGQSGRTSGTNPNQPVNDIDMPQVQPAVRTISRQGLVDTFA